MTDLMKDLEGIPVFALEKLKNAETTGEGVKLPFPALYAFVTNGDPKQKAAAKTAPALYYGGFATDAVKAGELVDDGSLPHLPEGWAPFSGVGEKGDWDGLCVRAITIARIASRAHWINQEARQSGPHYDAAKGLTRQHLQVLCLLYSASKPFGYCVLTAKGFQAKNLMDAFTAWKTAIGKYAKEINASTIPLGGFAITIGTQGEQPDYVSVGKAATSKITPIKALIPDDFSAEKLAKRFIGAQNLSANAERLDIAAEWLAAWQKRDVATDDQGAEAAPPVEEIPW